MKMLWSLAAVAVLAGAADATETAVKLPALASANPVYFRLVFGTGENRPSMLGVLDEAATGKGYSRAIVDENMNGDLSDDPPKAFPRTTGPRAANGAVRPSFEVKGPDSTGGRTAYDLEIYSLAGPRKAEPLKGGCPFFLRFKIESWSYFFINGTVSFYPTAAEALRGTPLRLGGPCSWEIASSAAGDQPSVTAGLKDENGSTLRVVSQAEKPVVPELRLLRDGREVLKQKMEFG